MEFVESVRESLKMFLPLKNYENLIKIFNSSNFSLTIINEALQRGIIVDYSDYSDN